MKSTPQSSDTPETDPTQGGEAAYIPFGYHADFINYLADNKNLFEIITYTDLMWSGDRAFDKNYPDERFAWNKALKEGLLDRKKIYVLIQHDVDTRPERTLNLLRHEQARGVRSNVMLFNKRVNRRKLAATGQLEYTGYDLDFNFLKDLQADGFLFGYHSNALEQALFDFDLAQQIFRDDVAELRRKLNIDFYTAHGGTPGPNNINNRDLPPPPDMLAGIQWVHNGATPWFDSNYSDGGINSPKRDPSKRDLRDFVRQWKPGNRYRVLTHPQYYHDPCGRSPRLSGTAWYEEVRAAYNSGDSERVWSGVKTVENERVSPLVSGKSGVGSNEVKVAVNSKQILRRFISRTLSLLRSK
ncbi:MAG: hypothetical protein H6964_06565 [Chromatiaceae bacterium]|nr:hypothetical protein [Chromatiaceae bacterium]MCP5446642.1 hypothetical protein [Chromatiaceae bacterium]